MSAIATAKHTPKAIPPSSTFGELLRRSKFASYDPSIRQAYAAPPSYVHRGNWGLKRPIANRSRRGAIVLRKFEEHAQYIEWNRAEHQVKVVKSVEEMGITPTLVPQTSWFIGLGQAATAPESGLDSDFCPGENPVFEMVQDERYADEVKVNLPKGGFKKDDVSWDTVAPLSTSSSASTSASVSASASSSSPINLLGDLKKLGNAGKGAYGAKARASVNGKEGDDALLQPNIQSMTPIEFQRYIEKLRKLRPEFLQYMRKQLEKDWDNNDRCLTNTDPRTIKDEDLVFTFATEARFKNLHMGFLGRYMNEHMFNVDAGEAEMDKAVEVKTEAEVEAEAKKEETVVEKEQTEGFNAVKYAEDLANRPAPIRKQPHKLGGLMYATPTTLENYFFVKSEPGIILQDPKRDPYSQTADNAEYVAAFGGMTSRLRKKDAGTVLPLYSPVDGGIIAPRIPDPENPGKVTFYTGKSEEKMRVISLELEDTPVVVGEDASNKPLLTTRLRSRVVVESAIPQTSRDNPYLPGSREYIDAQTTERLMLTARMREAGRSKSMTYLAGRLTNVQSQIPQQRIPGVTNAIKPALPTDTPEKDPGKKDNRLNVLESLGGMLTKSSIAGYRARAFGFGRSKSVEVTVDDEKKDP